MRMDEIVVIDSGHQDETGNAELKIKQQSLAETFCDPNIRAAAWIGCALSMFQ